MDAEAAKFIAAGLTSLGMLGAAVGVGTIVGKMVEGIARNPSTEGKLKQGAFIGMAFAEAMGLFALGLAFYILSL